jgi:hypothetical protein
MDLIKKTYKHSIIAIIPVALLSAFIEWKRLPFSVLIGGFLGLVNIKGLAWGVSGFMGSYKASAKMIFFSMLRLFMLFIIMFMLVYLKLVNIFGMLVGFTVVFVTIVIEGLKYAKNLPDS